MECVVKKDDMLAVLPTGCAFSRTTTAGNATFSWNRIARDFRAPASTLVLWTSYLQIGPWDSEETLCIFLATGLLSREDTEDGSALLTRDDTVNVDSIYGDELRIDHIYRSLNKCHSFTCPSELRSFAVIVRGFVCRLLNHR